MAEESLLIQLRKRMTLANKNVNGRKTSRVVKPKMFLSVQDNINFNYISNNEYAELFEFYKFLREYTNVSVKEIEKILKSKYINFAFLSKLYEKVPNMIETLREKGPLHVALMYSNMCLKEDFKIL